MSTPPFDNVRGVLFDLDGVVHIGDEAIAGAAATIATLRRCGIPIRFLTNTTTTPPSMLCDKMRRMGLPIEAAEILTTHKVAVRRLRDLGARRCLLLVTKEALPAYDGVPQSDVDPDYIVIGDIGNRWNYDLLDRVFGLVMNGARMLALHKGRYWRTGSGLSMDIGCFVAGLEYATGTCAEIVGKPSPTFFTLGLSDMGIAAADAIMIGDDIESDVGGAQRAGVRGVLVRTGKYREDTLARSSVVPAAVLDSVAQLPDALGLE